ncbi:MAG: ParA family protein [Gemmataceae bacterium]|nr:ParA family protein [Gemmataceae bacterium]
MDELLRYFEQHPSLFIAAGAVVSAIAAVVGVWIKWIRLKKDRNELQDQVNDLNHQLGQMQATREHLEKDHAKAQQQTQEVRQELNAAQQQAQEKQGQLTGELETSAERIAQLEANERRAAKLVKHMLELEGRLWQKRPQSGTPRFRALSDRKMAIISVVNLKGGVGKTTVASHLGAALADRGYRPLLIDIDLQGSLSSMFIPADKIYERAKESGLLQHFLSEAAHHRGLNLLKFIAPILDDRAGLIAASDTMAYAELNLTMRWLLRLGKRDTRFLLRRALHQKRISNEYDVVLLDCPPLINTGCVNALAASDYVLVPITPSKKSAERVPQLLKMLHDLGTRINPNIEPLGMVLNRTHGNNLTAMEQDLWKQLQNQCQDVWGSPVYACRTHIRQTTEVRDAEHQFLAPGPGSELYDYFKRLVLELEERLPRECRRAATAPV